MAGLGLATLVAPAAAWGCACGCGVFDVSTSAMLPSQPGGMAYLEYDYQNQNRVQNGQWYAPLSSWSDKQIQTSFTTLGLQYFFNRSWGVQAEIPYWFRSFTTDVNYPTPPAQLASRNWSGLGDIRLKGYYTGFSEDMSSGLEFGVKLPTGAFNRDADVVDRDTEIGSGSTDVLLGAFFRHNLNTAGTLTWFGHVQLDVPCLVQDGYRPGLEVDAATGIYYHGLSWGRVQITPLAQVIGSVRGRDNGWAADPEDSGYQRILLSPGLEFHIHPVTFYTDVEIPVYANVKGHQLVAPVLIKAQLSYMF